MPAIKLMKRYCKVLLELGCVKEVINFLWWKFDDVLPVMIALPKMSKRHIPFLPIIPTSLMTLRGLMLMVEDGVNMGRIYAKEVEDADDLVETPAEPYFILDIDNGMQTLGLSPDEVCRQLAKIHRSPLTAAEVIALGIFSRLLPERCHSLCAAGSTLTGNRIPLLTHQSRGGCLVDYEPVLYWHEKTERSCILPIGTPSCRRRIA